MGYGRVGRRIGEALAERGMPFVVAEQNRAIVEELRERGVPAVSGDARSRPVLVQAHVARARLLVIATPDPFQARKMIEIGRKMNAKIDTVVRTHSAGAQTYFEGLGVGRAFMGEHELAVGMARYALGVFGQQDAQAEKAPASP